MKTLKPVSEGLLLAALLAFTGCSSAPAQQSSNTPAADEKTAETDSSTSTDKQNSSSDAVTESDSSQNKDTAAADSSSSDSSAQNLIEYGDGMRNAFQDAGYETIDVEQEHDEYSFESRKEGRTSDIDIHRYASADSAYAAYEREIRDETEDDDQDYSQVQSGQNDQKYLTLLEKKNRAEYRIIACDRAGMTVTEIDDIPADSYTDFLKIMNQLGYPEK